MKRINIITSELRMEERKSREGNKIKNVLEYMPLIYNVLVKNIDDECSSEKRLVVFEMKGFREKYGIRRVDGFRNERIWEKVGYGRK